MSTTSSATAKPEGVLSSIAGPNKLMQALLIAAILASGVSMVFSFGTALVASSNGQPASNASSMVALD